MTELSNELIRATLRRGQNQRDPALVKEAAAQFRSLEDAAGEAECLDILGEMRYSAGAFVDAAGYYQQSLQIYKAIGQRGNEARCHYLLSKCFAIPTRAMHGIAPTVSGERGNSGEQEEQQSGDEISHLKEALDIAGEISDRDLQIHCSIALGACYRIVDPPASRDYYQNALALLDPMKKGWLSAQCHQSLGHFFAGSSDDIKARKHYLAAIEDYEEAREEKPENIASRLAQCHESIGDLALREFDEDEAIERFEQAVRLLDEIQSRNIQRVREKLDQLKFD